MANSPLNGLIAVATTPFDADGNQNLEMFRESCERVVAAGAQGILSLGATGEALALSASERKEQLLALVELAAGRVFTVAGCMAYTPARSLEMIEEAKAIGVDAVMITPSFYGGLTPENAIGHLEEIVKNSSLPVMVYNNPGATGVDLLPENIAELNGLENLWSVKETSGAATRVRELRDVLDAQVEVFVGADGLALEGFTQGATGWVAASAWLAPKECADLWGKAAEGDWNGAVALWNKLAGPLGQIEGSDAFISLIKKSLSESGFDQGPVRPPLQEAADDEVARLLEALSNVS